MDRVRVCDMQISYKMVSNAHVRQLIESLHSCACCKFFGDWVHRAFNLIDAILNLNIKFLK